MKLFNVKLLLVLVGVGLLFLGFASVSFATDKATEDAIKNSATQPERDVVVPPKAGAPEKDNPDITKAASRPEGDVVIPPKGASTSKSKTPARAPHPEGE
ncbi:MAG: hypothetical protein HQK60_06640 [Deltaproteobacteria bacterium]|nr:hypothetical protein [Deltaproteobacteria bacterium]